MLSVDVSTGCGGGAAWAGGTRKAELKARKAMTPVMLRCTGGSSLLEVVQKRVRAGQPWDIPRNEFSR
jgi:hypothetical protein